MVDFSAQDLTNTAWAFATASEAAPPLLNPVSVLDLIELKGSKPELMYYDMSMQGLAASSQIQAGFALLERAETCGLLSHCDDHCYSMFHALVQACRMVGDSSGASQVQAAMDRLGITSLAPMATALVQGSSMRYRNGVEGKGVADA